MNFMVGSLLLGTELLELLLKSRPFIGEFWNLTTGCPLEREAEKTIPFCVYIEIFKST